MSDQNLTAQEQVLARYNSVSRKVDALGRSIGVRKLRPSQQAHVMGMTPDLDGMMKASYLNQEGEEVFVDSPRRGPLMIAAAVCEIDGRPIPFPKTRAELDSTLDALDEEGIEAAGLAMMDLIPNKTPDEAIASAKNSQGTRSSVKR